VPTAGRAVAHRTALCTEVTWNPTTGCDRVSPGCDNCYATLSKRLKAMGVEKYQPKDDLGEGRGRLEGDARRSADLGPEVRGSPSCQVHPPKPG